ncbi:MAG: CAP domain-containing protein [Candidatus Magasanikbacteria bacterium]|jgi:hypothetical protein
MRKTLKKYFIPHRGNNYHPHILHTKRAVFYAGVFVAMKVLVVGFVLLLPLEAFVMPDVLVEEQRQIIAYTNEIRERQGLPTMSETVVLDRSAGAKALDMASNGYFAHEGPKQRNLAYFLGKAGYDYETAGENLAMGFADAREVVDAWVKSPTHLANLIDKDFTDLGIGIESGYYDGVPTVYIAQHLGLPATVSGKKAEAIRINFLINNNNKNIETPLKKVAGENILATTTNLVGETASATSAGVVKFGGPTPMQKYMTASHSLGSLTSMFDLTRSIYLSFIIFFGLALILKIFIEIRKQHPHVIAQTLGLLGLLVCFYLV